MAQNLYTVAFRCLLLNCSLKTQKLAFTFLHIWDWPLWWLHSCKLDSHPERKEYTNTKMSVTLRPASQKRISPLEKNNTATSELALIQWRDHGATQDVKVSFTSTIVDSTHCQTCLLTKTQKPRECMWNSTWCLLLTSWPLPQMFPFLLLIIHNILNLFHVSQQTHAVIFLLTQLHCFLPIKFKT